MKVGIFGTGMVGQTLGTRLQGLGHAVVLGARETGNEKATAWAAKTGGGAGTFADAAKHGEIIINATLGSASLDAIGQAGDANVDGKVLIDAANPLDFSKGMPPTLSIVNTDSLGERIQRAFPKVRVVKALNTITAEVMAHPERVNGGDHHLLISGNDAEAKTIASGLLAEMGWKNIVDLGDITTARGTEMYLALWIRLWGALHTADFNIKIVR